MRISKTQLEILGRMDSGALLYGSVYPEPYRVRWEITVNSLRAYKKAYKSETVRITTVLALLEKGFIKETERKLTQPYWRRDYELTEAGRALLAEKEKNHA